MSAGAAEIGAVDQARSTARPFRALASISTGRKGLILGHAIGMSAAFYLAADRVLKLSANLPFTAVIEIPIRLVAIWLLLDLFGRERRTRFGLWDYSYMSFVALYGLGVIYADVMMWRQTGFLNYVDWVLGTLSPFLFFVVVREACLRRGFRADVMIWWILGTLVFCALLGLCQALDLFGLRIWSAFVWNWQFHDALLQGPSAYYQARGTTAHANAHALYMVLGFCVAPVLGHWPKYRKYIVPLMVIFIIGAYSTYSRMGMLAIFTCITGAGLFLLVRRSVRAGFAVLGTVGALATIFVVLVFSMDVQRYKVPLQGEGVVRGSRANIISYDLRWKASMAAIDVGSKYPIFGVAAVGGAVNELRVISANAYSFDIVLNSLLPYTFATHGIVGLLFAFGLFLALFRTAVLETKILFLDASLFMLGVCLLTGGVSENTLFLPQQMTIVNCIVGLMFGYGWVRMAKGMGLADVGLAKWKAPIIKKRVKKD